MAAQVRKTTTVVEPVGLLQLFEHRHKALRCKTCLCHHRKTDAVGFAFHIARVVQLALRRRCLTAGNHRVGCLTIGVAFAGCKQAQNHRPHHPRRLRRLVRHIARNVALCDVAQLMTQYRRQFVAVADHCDQAQMHPKISTGQGKRVHRSVAPEQQLPGKCVSHFGRQLAARFGCRQQGLPNTLQVRHGDRVVDIVGVAVQAADNAVAQPTLVGQRHLSAITQMGQGVDRQSFSGKRSLRQQNAGQTGAYERQCGGPQPAPSPL